MTTYDAYETVIILLNHAREDILEEGGIEKQDIALEVTNRLLSFIEETKSYILEWKLEKLIYGKLETISSDSCEELFKYIYDTLLVEGKKIIEEASLTQDFNYVKTIVGYMGDILEKNEASIIRSCLLPESEGKKLEPRPEKERVVITDEELGKLFDVDKYGV